METKRICSRYGCTEGGENQRALCTIVGGPGRKDDGRTIKFGLKILGIDRSIYNMLVPTSCNRPSPYTAMSHFKGALKAHMYREECNSEYNRSAKEQISC